LKTAAKTGATPLLTDEQVAALKMAFEEEGRKVQLTAALKDAWAGLSDNQTERLQKAGKVPYRVTASLIELRNKGDSVVKQTLLGKVSFYVVDAENNVIAQKSDVPLEQLGPGSKGYVGEAPKVGNYKLIVWTEVKKAGRLGMVATENLQPPPKRK
jgi:hypothetical protein